MNELVKHIEILLLSKDCVIVPNFGGFVAHHVDAHYEENDCLFFPPLRTIGFNPQLKLNDSLLVQSYVDAYEMSYPDAYEIASLQQSMANLAERQAEAAETIQPVAVKSSKATLVNMAWVRNAAVACAVIFAFFFIPQLKMGQEDTTGNVNTSLLSRVMPKDIVNGTPDLSSANLSQEVEASMGLIDMPSFVKKTGKPNLLFVSNDSSKPYYSIILASHVTIDNAIEYVNQLHSLGYQEAKILSKGSTKVLYGQFDTKEEAYNVLIPLKDTDNHFADAWVMKVEF